MTLYKGNEITYRLPRNYLCSMTCKALSHKGLRPKRFGGLPRLPFPDGRLEGADVLTFALPEGNSLDSHVVASTRLRVVGSLVGT